MQRITNQINSECCQCNHCGCVQVHNYDTVCNFCGTPFIQAEIIDDNNVAIGFLDDSYHIESVTVEERKNFLKSAEQYCAPIQDCLTVEEKMRFVWNYEYLWQTHKLSHKLQYAVATIVAGLFGFPLMFFIIGILVTFFEGEIGASIGLMCISTFNIGVIMIINNSLLSPQLRFHKKQYMNAKKSLKTIGR